MKKNKSLDIKNKIDMLALKRLKVLDEDNLEIPFIDLWKGKTTIIVFVRHFGCISCRAHVDQIWNKRKDLRKKKNKIVFIGSGTTTSLKMFKEHLNVKDARIFTDPTLQTFQACGLLKGFKYLVNAKTLKKIFALHKLGYENKVTDMGSGSHMQMGGILAFREPGVLLYHFAAEYIGDEDDPEQWPEDLSKDSAINS